MYKKDQPLEALILQIIVIKLMNECNFSLQHILSAPEDIVTMAGARLPLKCSVDYISFSAHTDYQQTSEFIRILKPTHIVSVE